MLMATAATQQQQQQQQPQTKYYTQFKTNAKNLYKEEEDDDNNDDDLHQAEDDDDDNEDLHMHATMDQTLPMSSSLSLSSLTATTTTTFPTTTATTTSAAIEKSLASLELQYFKAVSLYRRRNYEKCVEVCNSMLQTGHENNVQMFHTPPDEEDNNDDNNDENISKQADAATGSNSLSNSSQIQQRYSSNLQHITSRQGGRQRGLYGNNNNNNISSSSAAAAAATNAAGSSGASTSATSLTSGGSLSVMPTWMMEGVWQLKMRALTQRIYIDDLETNDADDAVNEEVEFERIATTARPGTSIKTAFIPRPATSTLRSSTASSMAGGGLRTAGGGLVGGVAKRMLSSGMSTSRPTSGMARPGTSSLSRPGSSLGNRPASRCGTASRVRSTSAAAFTVGDATAPLYQASRLNPTIYAERKVLVKALFHFLYYHEAEVQKAYSLCEAVMDVQKQKRVSSATLRSLAQCDEWWWHQQMGRCLLALRYPKKAEIYLHHSLNLFPHPDTYLLLSRLYQRLDMSRRAMDLIQSAVDKHPFDVTFRVEQGRLLDTMSNAEESLQMYRLTSRLNPINVEALACIALNYFYDNNPEMALMYYRRILALGVHSAELYCNIALCCLYGGQIDLVLPCFQRALTTAKTSDQKADIWYNLSFVAITTGDFNLGRRCLQLCLTSDASNGAALNNLAVLAAHTGDILKAKSYLNAAKEVLQDSKEIELNLKYINENYKL